MHREIWICWKSRAVLVEGIDNAFGSGYHFIFLILK